MRLVLERMDKDLQHISNIVRKVLFEKTQTYNYKTRSGYGCMERCNVKSTGSNGYKFDTMIGSIACTKCEHNKEFDNEKNYIICRKIKEATKKEN
jgi:hypothetical protein